MVMIRMNNLVESELKFQKILAMQKKHVQSLWSKRKNEVRRMCSISAVADAKPGILL